MAQSPPTDPSAPRGTVPAASDRAEKLRQRREAEDRAVLREIDEAVRQDQMAEFGKRYGKPLVIGIVLFLLLLGGFMLWQQRQERAREQASEGLVTALDQVEAGNLAEARQRLQPLAASSNAGVSASARLLEAGIAAQEGNLRRSGELFAAIADDGDVPAELRQLARVRQVTVQFDDLPPQRVIALLGDQVRPGQPFFGSAAELVAMAQLELGQRQQAGALFAQIARANEVPESLRSRTRQMAGLLGVDTIENVEEVIVPQGSAGQTAPGQLPQE